MEHPESIPLETLHTQDGNIKELCQPIKTEKFSNLIANRQFSGQSSINVMNSTAREFLSSINASSAAISGLYCTGVETNVKDMTSPSCASSTVLSGMHSYEGIIKEYGAFSSLKNPGIPKSHVTGMTIPGSSHIQKPWNSQRPQNHEIKSLEKEASSQPTVRIARPPSEGRGKNQLLPRYWPRVTDQELQLLTAKEYPFTLCLFNTSCIKSSMFLCKIDDMEVICSLFSLIRYSSNCVVTPLFEKVLSMSDAGKIGRLVLPKACAEEFFPPISQAEGLPIVIQDVSGKDWHFQFRFWPNNNSRMYVLEGITPYIQSMQLQAGDTVVFSRRDPERKLVMGYRRASNNSTAEDAKTTNSGSTSMSPIMQTFPRKMDRTSSVADAACLDPQQAKSYSRAQVMVHKNFANVSSPHAQGHSHVFPKPGNIGSKGTREASTYNLSVFSDRRKAKDIASKAKRPKYDSNSLEFKMNWEEAQSLLRSPPNVIPNIVTIEGYDFEEYEDPPVFGNGAVFTGGLQGKISNIHQSRLKDATEVLLQHATGQSTIDILMKN
ncbi:hypothetical protein KP509_1Z276200 [Ceratopteris richardii]|nr:hypothetical protein KP509_1Z276200 [Ceratopteris richardii]